MRLSVMEPRKRKASELPPQLFCSKRLRLGSDCSGYNSGTLGAEALSVPYVDVFASDNNAKCREVLKFNFKDLNSSNVYADCTRRDLNSVPGCDIYTAGFPCQAFSTEGLGAGESDPRGRVVWSVLEYIKVRLPSVFVLENVKALVDRHTDLFYRIFQAIANIRDAKTGKTYYFCSWKVVNSRYYVAQSRNRVYIVGLKRPLRHPFRWPEPCAAAVTLNASLSVHRGRADGELPSSKTGLANLEKSLKEIARDKKEGKKCKHYIVDLGTSTRRTILYRDIAPCLTKTRCQANDYYLMSRGRRLTLAELFRLQGVPAHRIRLPPGVTEAHLRGMIGNAWTVPVYAAILRNALLSTGLATVLF